jgi:hypothetical protein
MKSEYLESSILVSLMRADRTFFAPAEKRQVGPKNPWFFRSLLLIAFLLCVALQQIVAPGGYFR